MQTRLKTLILPLVTAGALALGAGCASHDDRTAGRVIDDRMVTGKVKDALDDAPVYKFNDVRVSTYNGVVQLSGWVTTDEQKQQAGEIAGRVEGVRDVVNGISIKLTPTGREQGYPRRGENDPPSKADAPVKSRDID